MFCFRLRRFDFHYADNGWTRDNARDNVKSRHTNSLSLTDDFYILEMTEYRFTLLIMTPTSTPSLVKTSLTGFEGSLTYCMFD